MAFEGNMTDGAGSSDRKNLSAQGYGEGGHLQEVSATGTPAGPPSNFAVGATIGYSGYSHGAPVVYPGGQYVEQHGHLLGTLPTTSHYAGPFAGLGRGKQVDAEPPQAMDPNHLFHPAAEGSTVVAQHGSPSNNHQVLKKAKDAPNESCSSYANIIEVWDGSNGAGG